MSNTNEYLIKKGDTLTGIAKAHGVTVDQLVKENGIKNPNLIYAGSKLRLPTSGFTEKNDVLVGGEFAKSGNETNSTGFTPSKDTIAKGETSSDLRNQYLNYGDITVDDTTLKDVMDKILNREPFSYDLNGDALYQQYKDKYIQQGKMAMQDTMGQAAAMTGGYGNSYAATVGNQAYQASLENLNDIVPELYQMAYDKYAQEGQDLYNQYGMLSDDYGRRYNEELDKYNMLGDKLAVADSDYWNSLGYENDQYWEDTKMRYAMDETNKGYARQDAYAMLQAGIMPSDDVLNNAGISKADAQSIANAYKGGDDETINAIKNNPSAKIKIDESTGKPVVVDDPKSNIPQNVRDTLKGLKTNQQKEDYLWGLVEDKTITEEQMNALYAENRNSSADLNKRTWTKVTNGGWNLFGVDENAIVKDQYGNQYRLDKLVDALIADGMSKSEAKDYVKDLQFKLGIDKKWNPFK